MHGASGNSLTREFAWAGYTALIVWAVVIPIYFTGLGLAFPITIDDLGLVTRWSVAVAMLAGVCSAVRGGPIVVAPALVALGLSPEREMVFVRGQTMRHLLLATAIGACAGSALASIGERHDTWVDTWLTTSLRLALAATAYVACAQLWHRRRLLAIGVSSAALVAAVLSLPVVAIALPIGLALGVTVTPPAIDLPTTWTRSQAAAEAHNRATFLDVAAALSLLRQASDGDYQNRVASVSPIKSAAPWYYLHSLLSLPTMALLRLILAPLGALVLAHAATSSHMALVLIGVSFPFFTLAIAEPMSALKKAARGDASLWPSASWTDLVAVVSLSLIAISPLLVAPGVLGAPAALGIGTACGLCHGLWAAQGSVEFSELTADTTLDALAIRAAIHGLGPWLLYLIALAAIGFRL